MKFDSCLSTSNGTHSYSYKTDNRPSKGNVMFTPSNFTSMEHTSLLVAKKLFDEGVDCHRIIIYCRCFGNCASVYLYFKTFLGAQ